MWWYRRPSCQTRDTHAIPGSTRTCDVRKELAGELNCRVVIRWLDKILTVNSTVTVSSPALPFVASPRGDHRPLIPASSRGPLPPVPPVAMPPPARRCGRTWRFFCTPPAGAARPCSCRASGSATRNIHKHASLRCECVRCTHNPSGCASPAGPEGVN
eukprot:8337888-Pyramimonas_sp.AAC.1